jgi:hypothetical protein
MSKFNVKNIVQFYENVGYPEDEGNIYLLKVEPSNCCGFYEVYGFQDEGIDTKYIDIQCFILENWEHIKTSCAGFFINPVSSWPSYKKIATALRKGGWKLVMKPTKNPNSGNMITTWIYTVGTQKPVKRAKVRTNV